MTTQTNEVLEFFTTNAPPELDFLFALARGTEISITAEHRGAKQEISIYVDGVHILDEERNEWKIRGRILNGEKTDWISFGFLHTPPDIANLKDSRFYQVRREYYLWGSFLWKYNKKTRKGALRTKNFKRVGW